MQFTMVSYFFGFSLAQLACAPLADAYGRRSILALFLCAYVAGSITALMMTTIDGLAAARLVQGIGATAGVTITRAIVRDLFDDERAGQVLVSIGTMLAILPALAPGVGGILLTFVPWHALFGLMTAFGIALLLLCLLRIEETNLRPDPRKAAPLRVAVTYLRLLKKERTRLTMAIAACSIGCVYMFSTQLAFVATGILGLSPAAFGAAMILQSGLYTLGAIIGRLLLKRNTAMGLVLPATLLMVVAALLLSVNAVLGTTSLLTVFLPVGIYAFGVAMATLGFTVQALRGVGDDAGAASALLGFPSLAGAF